MLKTFIPTLNGLATRVARQAGFSPGYVTRVIHGGRKSEVVDGALTTEYRRVLEERRVIEKGDIDEHRLEQMEVFYGI
jgi:hypothetical protein